MSEIYNIDIDNLYHHPANPRKDIGDITELANSIKAQGVMQNLTVIPVHYFEDDWDRVRHEEELLRVIDELKEGKATEDILFYVLIGNRRLEASLAAGLTELPCKIVTGLSKDEQIAIMLTENMQRSDLTVQEEAIGFQQMLDFGSDIEEISNISGLSETTVRHRVNIAKLDQKLVKDALDKQINLTDFIELEKISDIDKRNEILKKSSDIKWSVKRELEIEESKKQKDEIIKAIRENFLLDEVPEDARIWGDEWEFVQRFNFGEEIDTTNLPKERLYYRVGYREISVYRMVEEDEIKENPEEIKRKMKDEIRTELIEKEKLIKEKVSDYIQFVIDQDRWGMNATERLWNFILENNIRISDEAMDDLTAWVEDRVKSDEGMSEDELTTKLYEEAQDLRLEHQLLALIYEDMQWKAVINRWGDIRNSGDCGKWETFIDLIHSLYDFPGLDEEQQAVLDGTHELYKEAEESE